MNVYQQPIPPSSLQRQEKRKKEGDKATVEGTRSQAKPGLAHQRREGRSGPLGVGLISLGYLRALAGKEEEQVHSYSAVAQLVARFSYVCTHRGTCVRTYIHPPYACVCVHMYVLCVWRACSVVWDVWECVGVHNGTYLPRHVPHVSAPLVMYVYLVTWAGLSGWTSVMMRMSACLDACTQDRTSVPPAVLMRITIAVGTVGVRGRKDLLYLTSTYMMASSALSRGAYPVFILLAGCPAGSVRGERCRPALSRVPSQCLGCVYVISSRWAYWDVEHLSS